ncbi:Vitamin B6 photo-protection and homoeostasis protein [Gracilaria domingensis]|nr:Vitamin B6 photo-protection and homoeostasis protein [Gracilaria domingensis]
MNCAFASILPRPWHKISYRNHAASSKHRRPRDKLCASADPVKSQAIPPSPPKQSLPRLPTLIERTKDSVYKLDLNTLILEHVQDRSSSNRNVKETSPARSLFYTLLPTGYPDTVHPGYIYWAIWHIGRHIFRQSYYVLGTTSLLSSLGLSTNTSLAVGATLKWVLKDGLGMGTKLLLSTSLARLVDADPKRFRMLGDTMMACAALIEVLSVLNPRYFLAFGTIAALLREAAGAMSGPAYRVFLDSFAGRNNIGDVSSRGEAQVVIGNLLGLGLGVIIRQKLDALQGGIRLAGTLAAFLPLAASHLFCTKNAVGTVRLRTLNWQRVNHVIDVYLKDGSVPSVEKVNRSESLLPIGNARRLRSRIVCGASLREFEHVAEQVADVLRELMHENVIVVYDGVKTGVILGSEATVNDMMFGLLWARKVLDATDNESQSEEHSHLVLQSFDWAKQNHDRLQKGLREEGWSIEKLLIPLGKSRYVVNNSKA